MIKNALKGTGKISKEIDSMNDNGEEGTAKKKKVGVKKTKVAKAASSTRLNDEGEDGGNVVEALDF